MDISGNNNKLYDLERPLFGLTVLLGFAVQLATNHSFMSSLMKNLMFLWMKSVLILNPEHLLTQMQAKFLDSFPV